MKKLVNFFTDFKSGRALKLSSRSLNFSMLSRVANPLKITILTFGLGLFLVVSCAKREQPPDAYGVNFTPCQQVKAKSAENSDAVEVEFTGEGVNITYYGYEVTCDFTVVNATHTLVNGVLSITLQSSPSRADCVCYTDVSYTIEGILQEEVNVIFVDGEQVYCYNNNYSYSIWECVLEHFNITITLTIDDYANLASVGKSPKEDGHNDQFHQFRDGHQYLMQNDTLYFKDVYGEVCFSPSCSFEIIKLSENEMRLNYLGILPDYPFYIRDYLFTRIK